MGNNWKIKAKDLYFVIQEGNDDHGLGHCAIIVPIKYWDEHKCWDDRIGGHNVNNNDLIDGGCCTGELMEGIFEAEYDETPDSFKEKMIAAGFVHNEKLLNTEDD